MLKEITKIGDKSYIKVKVVMLTTNEKTPIVLMTMKEEPKYILRGYNLDTNYGNDRFQHLYITSNEEIKESDWCIFFWNNGKLGSNTPKQYIPSKGHVLNNGLRKVIASTDTHLGLPQPSSQFIRKYIEEYNKGYIITDVLVECETKLEWTYSHSGRKIQEEGNPFLKVDKNNYITITKVKDSWSRDEVKQLCWQAFIDHLCINGKIASKTAENSIPSFNRWIEENL